MRLLFLTPRPFWPPRRGEQARLLGFLGHLVGRHQVRTVTLVPPGFAPQPAPLPVEQRSVPLGLAAAAWGLLTHPLEPWQVAMHRDIALKDTLLEELARFRPHLVVLMLSRLGWVAPELSPVPLVIDFIDSLFLNMHQRAWQQKLAAPFWLWEAFRCRRFDRALLRRAKLGTVVSSRDKQALVEGDEALAAKVEVVPFGVRVPETLPRRQPEPATLLLTGNLGYFPTWAGLQAFAKRVWPHLQRQFPNLRFVVAGSRPGPAVRRLQQLGIQVIPEPEDLEPLRQKASLFVAPLVAGSGTPIKVLEAMAAGIPVVASPAAVAGLDQLPPEAVLVARSAEEWVEAVATLLRDPRQAQRQVQVAFHWVKSRHELSQAAQLFETLLTRAAHV